MAKLVICHSRRNQPPQFQPSLGPISETVHMGKSTQATGLHFLAPSIPNNGPTNPSYCLDFLLMEQLIFSTCLAG